MLNKYSFRNIFLLVLFFAWGCSAGSQLPAPITVEGTITVRGNEPFTTYVLETDEQNSYVLIFEEGAFQSQMLRESVTVTGEILVKEWGGIPFTHLRVLDTGLQSQ